MAESTVIGGDVAVGGEVEDEGKPHSACKAAIPRNNLAMFMSGYQQLLTLLRRNVELASVPLPQ